MFPSRLDSDLMFTPVEFVRVITQFKPWADEELPPVKKLSATTAFNMNFFIFLLGIRFIPRSFTICERNCLLGDSKLIDSISD